MWPMYIRSTTLYSTLISWATVMGIASRRMLPETLPWEKSLVLVMKQFAVLSGRIVDFSTIFYRSFTKLASLRAG